MNTFTKLLCCLVLFTSVNPSYATDSFADVDLPQKIVLTADDQLGIIYTHQLKKNQTIFGLSKFFNTDLSMISAANPSVDLSDVKLDQKINIPINTAMITSERNLSPQRSYIPVFYTVKAKDNLFRISKVYFHQSIENVMNINNLKTMDLSIGQKILVGWYQYDAKYKESLAWKDKGIEVETTGRLVSTSIITSNPIVADNRKRENSETIPNAPVFQKKVITPAETAEPIKSEKTEVAVSNAIVSENKKKKEEDFSAEVIEIAKDEGKGEGVRGKLSNDPFENRNSIYEGNYDGKPTIHNAKIRAEWNMSSKDKINLFALHATAKVNSYIEIYNPMLNRKVIAKVVGNLPPKAHKKNVDLIISPKVAETLGAVDKRFYVQVRFIE